MAEKIKIQVVTPSKIVVDDEANIVMAPGSDGEFGVLSGHTPFLTGLYIKMDRHPMDDGLFLSAVIRFFQAFWEICFQAACIFRNLRQEDRL